MPPALNISNASAGATRRCTDIAEEEYRDNRPAYSAEASLAALGNLDMKVVVTTGHHPLPRDLGPLPPNVIHEPYVPGLAMAALSDVLIHHGGYGSCQTALHAGKPSVILPTYSERESNARRLGETLQKEGGARRAAELIEDFSRGRIVSRAE
jgi:UDP:flavonoid glycosyltransferase YjiC (YdhE family)